MLFVLLQWAATSCSSPCQTRHCHSSSSRSWFAWGLSDNRTNWFVRARDGSSLDHLLPDCHLPRGLQCSALSPTLPSAHQPEPICGSSGWFWAPLPVLHCSWDPFLQEQKPMEDPRSHSSWPFRGRGDGLPGLSSVFSGSSSGQLLRVTALNHWEPENNKQ